ncbi:hypothetical protein XELAEV_18038677mg [Xenopus laevis]|uniref:Uncharacterized protein n=1 Tax=Xenopus laevis TaxID=8355 RepID=A0A974H766_XENLA|nr:hypothetical protein XELAEV_18038677mg [Xenopus laevis]
MGMGIRFIYTDPLLGDQKSQTFFCNVTVQECSDSCSTKISPPPQEGQMLVTHNSVSIPCDKPMVSTMLHSCCC